MQYSSQIVTLLLLLEFTSISIPCVCQSANPTSLSTPDGNVIIPVKTGVLGQMDSGAVRELTEHLAAVGGNQWVGMKGTGTITYGPDNSTPYAATLLNVNMDEYRLDAQDQSGQTSIRIHGMVGKIRTSDGMTSSIPTETALSGLFPFEVARFALPSKGKPSISILDRGIAEVGRVSLHRITVESRFAGYSPSAKTKATHVIDFYFDSTTHLLAKSVVCDMVAGSRPVKFLLVVNYSDYRTVGGSLVPFRYTETMEGQPYWTLQLSDIQLNPTLPANYFEF